MESTSNKGDDNDSAASDVIKDDASDVIKCSICSKMFQTRSGLRRHVTKHGSYDHLCTICGKEYHNKHGLKEHMDSHTQSHMCSYCGKVFSKAHWLNVHERRSHGDGKSEFSPCKVCNKPILDKRAFEAHAYKHNVKPSPYACIKCKKSFHYKHTFQRHIGKCNGKTIECKGNTSAFPCPVCKKTFKDKRFLKQHQTVHMPGKFACEACGKAFKWNKCLAIHVKCCKGSIN